MPEFKKEDIVWWEIHTDSGTIKITQLEMDDFMTAIEEDKRFFRVGNDLINLAFVKGVHKIETVKYEEI